MDIAVQERPRQFDFLPIAESVSVPLRLVEVINANTSGISGACVYYDGGMLTKGAIGAVIPLSVTVNTYAVFCMAVYTGTVSEEYNPELVASLLRARSEEPEATFTNVIDMMEWLDRD